MPASRRLLVLCLALLALAAEVRAETVRLIPDDRAGFRARNLFAWLRPGYNYGERYIDVTTTPPGATLDLFYVRSNFQKRYEQAQAPSRVVLPKRAEAGPRDAVNIRAFLDGYRQKEVSIRISSSQKQVHIDLEPLPNRLEARLAHLPRRARVARLPHQGVADRPRAGGRVRLPRDPLRDREGRGAGARLHGPAQPARSTRSRRSSSARTCSCASSSPGRQRRQRRQLRAALAPDARRAPQPLRLLRRARAGGRRRRGGARARARRSPRSPPATSTGCAARFDDDAARAARRRRRSRARSRRAAPSPIPTCARR